MLYSYHLVACCFCLGRISATYLFYNWMETIWDWFTLNHFNAFEQKLFVFSTCWLQFEALIKQPSFLVWVLRKVGMSHYRIATRILPEDTFKDSPWGSLYVARDVIYVHICIYIYMSSQHHLLDFWKPKQMVFSQQFPQNRRFCVRLVGHKLFQAWDFCWEGTSRTTHHFRIGASTFETLQQVQVQK